MTEYYTIIDVVIEEIKKHFPNATINTIQIDFDTIDDVWKKIVKAIKNEDKIMSGLCDNKNKRIYKVILEQLRGALSQKNTYLSDNKDVFEYDLNSISINPPAFKTEYIGKPWKSIIDDPDAGLKRQGWFGINGRYGGLN